MNIINSFQPQMSSYNNINNRQNVTNTHANNTEDMKNGNVQFKGLPNILNRFRKIQIHPNYTSMLAGVLDVPQETIIDITKGSTIKRMQFLDSLVETFHARNYYVKDKTKKENPNHVLEIFQQVKEPTPVHFALVEDKKTSFESISKILKKVSSDKELQLVADIKTSKKYEDVPKDDEFIDQIFKSKNRKKIVKDFSDYKSYFVLNSENKDVVKNLDELIDSEKFDTKLFDKKLKAKKLSGFFDDKSHKVINPDVVEENFSDAGYELMYNLPQTQTVFAGLYNENPASKKALLNIFKTTTKNNFADRANVITDYANTFIVPPKPEDTFIHLDKLFTRMDADKHARNFVRKVNINDEGFPAEDINEMLDNVPSRKLDIFADNARNILFNTSRERRIETLKKEIENPLYASNAMGIDQYDNIITLSSFSKMKKVFKNKVNQAKFGFLEKFRPQPKKTKLEIIEENPIYQEVKPVVDEGTKTLGIKEIKHPTVIDKNTPVESVHTSKIQDTQQPVSNKTENVDTISKNKKLVISKFPKNVTAKKLKVINDVNDVIKAKLGAKTYSEQSRDFSITATKMRLNLLPEMFASVKETRKADRLAGKKKSNSSNKDVLALYEKINGKNRKLVNYMLKKRNVDGTRMFELRDIIDTLDKSNKKVRVSSLDARAYFEHLYNADIEQYGKVSRKKVVSYQ